MPHDPKLLDFPRDPEALPGHWRYFCEQYHRFSLNACRRALECFGERGLAALPSLRDPIEAFQ